MLVLTRRRDQSVIIGGTITVTVVDFDKDTVRLAVPDIHELRANQSLSLAPDISVIAVVVLEDKIRLGINVPKHVSVHRKEMTEWLESEDNQSTGTV